MNDTDYGVPTDTDWARLYRIPVAPHRNTRWRFIVALVVDEPASVVPTDAEVRAVASFLEEYKSHWYTRSYVARMADRPFDIDGGANGTSFTKRPDGSWCYSKSSWTMQDWFPGWRWSGGPLTLLQLLDRIHTDHDGGVSGRWSDWKAQHRDVFTHPDLVTATVEAVDAAGR